MTKNEAGPIPREVQKLSFEEALEKLEAIVQKLESGDVKLEDSIEFYTRGTHLKSHCQAKLQDAQSKVEKLVVSAAGEASAEAIDID